MKTFVSIDDDQFNELCETVNNIHGEAMAQSAWSAIAALGIKPFRDGNQWCFLYGDNIQEGISGFGETVFDAAWDFYSNIINK